MRAWHRGWAFAALFEALAALVGCSWGSDGEGPRAPVGALAVRVNLPQEESASPDGSTRTVFPANMASWTYTLEFEYLGGTPGPAGTFSRPAEIFGAGSVNGDGAGVLHVEGLQIGLWALTAYGSAGGLKVAQSTRGTQVSVLEGETSEAELLLGPISDDGTGTHTGTLTYTATVPEAISGIAGAVTVTDLETGEPVEAAGNPSSFSGGGGSGAIVLPAGEFLVTMVASQPGGGGAATEVAHIYEGQTSVFAHTFTESDLAGKTITSRDLTAYVPLPVRDEVLTNPAYFAFDAPQFTGVIAWKLYVEDTETLAAGEAFQPGSVYKAQVTLSAKSGWTFAGVGKDSFTHSKAMLTNNAANSNIVTIVFPPTAGEATPGDINVRLGFNYEEIVVTSDLPADASGGYGILKYEAPESVLFTADEVYSTINWYVDGVKKTSGLGAENRTALVEAAGLAQGPHFVTFTAFKGGHIYSRIISLTVRTGGLTAVLREDTGAITYYHGAGGWNHKPEPATEDTAQITNPAVLEEGLFRIISRTGTIPVKFYEVSGAGTKRIVVSSYLSAVVLLAGASITPAAQAPLDLETGANVTLLLRGANTLTAAGVHVTTGRTLTITSADGDGQTTGSLTATGGSSGAGIGGGYAENAGTINIAGGTVNATGKNGAAGIGGGDGTFVSGGGAGIITISGGKVTATGSQFGAGIGTGNNGKGGSVTITGSAEVTAASPSYGAGIGTGNAGQLDSITISGSAEVTANGGNSGAGIGGGSSGTILSITITGGTVTATGGNYGAGIGGGKNYSGGTITINGGTITANGGQNGAGIGGGGYTGSGYGGAGGTIKINYPTGSSHGTATAGEIDESLGTTVAPCAVGPGADPPETTGSFNGVDGAWPTANPYTWP